MILVVESLMQSLGAMCGHFCISKLFMVYLKGFQKVYPTNADVGIFPLDEGC